MILASRELMPLIGAALERGQRVRMTATGSSMLPMIHDGDLLELEHMLSLPSLGDVVLARCAGERYILHRVVKIEGKYFFLCGDAQEHSEGPFVRDNVLGRVIRITRGQRTLALDRGIYHFVGWMWARCTPYGATFFWLTLRIRGKIKRLLLACHPFHHSTIN